MLVCRDAQTALYFSFGFTLMLCDIIGQEKLSYRVNAFSFKKSKQYMSGPIVWSGALCGRSAALARKTADALLQKLHQTRWKHKHKSAMI